jgi:hypothetical protein
VSHSHDVRPFTTSGLATSDAQAPRAAPSRWRGLAYAVALAFCALISYQLWRVPVQVSDSLGEILDAQLSRSPAASFVEALDNEAYLRPLRMAQIKILFDLAGGRHYHLVYRGFHVLLLTALVLLFTRALHVDSGPRFAAAAFALTVLVGLHTFTAFLREAFPINHFLEVAVLCLGAVALAQSRGGWWIELGACLMFVAAALTLESGLLVWVVVVGAWLAGLPGISRRGALAVTILLIGYVGWRFGVLDTGVPALTERGSGFLFERLEPDELQRRFGTVPAMFYAYNVATSFLSVLLAEPREGIFVATRALRDGEVLPRTYVAVASSVATTTVIGVWALSSVRRLARTRTPLDRDGSLAVVSVAVLLGSAAISYAYTKDDIIAVAGVFYAFLAFAAVRATLESMTRRGTLASIALVAVLGGIAGGWSLRAVAVDHVMRRQAFRVRGDWAEVSLRLRREDQWPSDAAGAALVERLQREALAAPIPNPQLLPEWHNAWFGD